MADPYNNSGNRMASGNDIDIFSSSPLEGKTNPGKLIRAYLCSHPFLGNLIILTKRTAQIAAAYEDSP
jgi:hypothetical protein